jgi:anti-sigma factor RsiW
MTRGRGGLGTGVDVFMSCREYEKLIDELVGGTLSGRLENELRAHLAVCPDCAAAHAELAAVVDLVKSAAREETSAEFAALVRAKLRLAESLERRPVRRASIWERILPGHVARPLAVAALAVLLVVMAVGPGMRPSPDTVDLAQTAFAQFCTTEHIESTASPPIANQAIEWLDSTPIEWSEYQPIDRNHAETPGEADG